LNPPGYSLDPARGVLANPQGREAGLRPKSAEVLRYLAEKAGRVVSREELMQAVWPDIFVTDDNITQCVAEIRRSLGDEGARLLRTLSKRGYLLAWIIRDTGGERWARCGGSRVGCGGARHRRRS
jgi:DNA-binding winged helix-turn-helix (wHTH) protein